MDSPVPEVAGAKRKRTPDDAGVRPPPLAVQRDSSAAKINYLTKGKGAPLKLIEGDSDTFLDVLNLIDDYEGMIFSSYAFSQGGIRYLILVGKHKFLGFCCFVMGNSSGAETLSRHYTCLQSN